LPAKKKLRPHIRARNIKRKWKAHRDREERVRQALEGPFKYLHERWLLAIKEYPASCVGFALEILTFLGVGEREIGEIKGWLIGATDQHERILKFAPRFDDASFGGEIGLLIGSPVWTRIAVPEASLVLA
jgi:hypothetical protein